MHPTRDTPALIFSKRLGRRVSQHTMLGVRLSDFAVPLMIWQEEER